MKINLHKDIQNLILSNSSSSKKEKIIQLQILKLFRKENQLLKMTEKIGSLILQII